MNQEGRKQKAESSGIRQSTDAQQAVSRVTVPPQAQPVSRRTAPPSLEPGNQSPVSNSQFPVCGLRKSQLEFLQKVVGPALESERLHQIPACVTIAQAILESAARIQVSGVRGQVSGTDLKPDTRHPEPAFEWRWGGSVLFREANNPFGIKWSHQQSQEGYSAFDAETWEVEHGKITEQRAAFARFPDLASAFKAHAQLFLALPRYQPAMKALKGSGDPAVGSVASGHLAIGSSGDFKSPDHPIPAWQAFAEGIAKCGYSTDPDYAAKLKSLVRAYRLDDPRALEWYVRGEDPGRDG